MAANRAGRRLRETGHGPQRRHARVTVKYNRRELQRRIDLEAWIDRRLDLLFRGREEEMPSEVNIDDLLELKTDEQRRIRLQEILHTNISTEVFISNLLMKLQGLQKQDELQSDAVPEPLSPTHQGALH